MATTAYPADVRQQVLEFAATYPTPNVRRAVEYAHAGLITWEKVYDLSRRALTAALAEVAEPADVPQPPRAGLVACPNGCGHWVIEGAYIDPTLPCP